MARKKVNRVSSTRRPRIPNSHVRYEIILPQSTITRLYDHCERNNLDDADVVRKAIYDALPVHYEVTEDFVFPFGKYAGETAGVVKRIDPSYIEWCKKSINGFKSKLVEEGSKPVSDPPNIHRHSPYWQSLLRKGEYLQFNANQLCWAYRIHPWGERYGWRKLGFWTHQ